MFSLMFSGNLGREPKYGRSEDGTPYALLSVAISRGKDAAPLWVSVNVVGKSAEYLAKILPGKGQKVVISTDKAPIADTFKRKDGTFEAQVKIRAMWIECPGAHEGLE